MGISDIGASARPTTVSRTTIYNNCIPHKAVSQLLKLTYIQNIPLYLTVTRCNTHAMRGHGGTGAPASITRTLELCDVRRQSFHYAAEEPHTHGRIDQPIMLNANNFQYLTLYKPAASCYATGRKTPELLQGRLQTPVRRSTPTAPYTELAHSSQNLLTPIISTSFRHYYYHVNIQKPEIHRPGEHYRRQPDPTGSTPQGRSLHISNNIAQAVLRQYYRVMLQFYTLTPYHGEIPMPHAPTERPSKTQV